MFSRLSIAQKIYSSFAIMIALLATISISAFLGVSTLSGTFDRYREGTSQTLAIAGFVENLAAARLADQQFRRNPSPETAAILAERIDTLQINDPIVMGMFAGDPEALAILEGLSANAGAYANAFARMAVHQGRVDTLVDEIGTLGAQMRANAGTAIQTATASANFNATGAAGLAVQNLMLTQFDVERFLLTNDPAVFESAFANGTLAHEGLTRLHGAVFSQDQKANVTLILTDLEAYAALMTEVRSEIDARNAIMAGDLDVLGPQMQAAYDQMLSVVSADQAGLGAAARAQADNTRLIVLAVAGVALLLGSGLALVIGRWLSGAIRRVATDMRQLAEGNLELALDEKQRHELGQMIEALAVFRDNSKAMRAMDAEKEETQKRDAAENAVRQDLQNQVRQVVSAAVAGDFSARIEKQFGQPDLDDVARLVNELIQTVDRGIGETGEVLSAMAADDLSRRMTGQYQGAFDRLKSDTNALADRFSDVVGRLQETSRALKIATNEILSGANDLSERTTKQAATIEETSAAMEQLSGTVNENAQRARTVSGQAEDASRMAGEGGEVMDQATRAMERITQSSEKISNIIGMIDDIAFQTNLLALNASVEAARAGEAGKGFAVVAVEVRRLAQSAAQASSEVKVLIEQSAQEVGGGSRLVAEAASKLRSILVAVKENAQVMTEISQASRDQAASLEEVSVAVRQLDEMTQHNAALVEQTNAAIEQTEAQASELDTIAALFDIDGSRATLDSTAWDEDQDDELAEPMFRSAY